MEIKLETIHWNTTTNDNYYVGALCAYLDNGNTISPHTIITNNGEYVGMISPIKEDCIACSITYMNIFNMTYYIECDGILFMHDNIWYFLSWD